MGYYLKPICCNEVTDKSETAQIYLCHKCGKMQTINDFEKDHMDLLEIGLSLNLYDVAHVANYLKNPDIVSPPNCIMKYLNVPNNSEKDLTNG